MNNELEKQFEKLDLLTMPDGDVRTCLIEMLKLLRMYSSYIEQIKWNSNDS